MIPSRNIKRFFYKAYRQPVYALKVFKKRLTAYFYYRFANGKSCSPEAITLFLTHRCNLRCKMCGQWGEGGITKRQSSQYIKEELSFDELKAIIDDVAIFKPNITLFGGEPLLYPYCVNLIKYIKDKNMHCLVITNGFLLGEFAEKLVDAKLDELNVSLDGGRGLHDEIRGMPGLYERITKGIKEVSRIKKEKDSKKPFINLQCTITKYNYKRLEELIAVAGDIEADSLTFHNLIFLGKGLIEKQKIYDKLLSCSSNEWEGFVFEPEIEPDALYKKINEVMVMAKGRGFTVDFYPNFSLKGLDEYYENPSYLPSEYLARCLSPWMSAYIFPDGEVRPCLNLDYSYGSIKNNEFTEIWNGAAAVKYRRVLKEKNIFPVCVRCTELYRY